MTAVHAVVAALVAALAPMACCEVRATPSPKPDPLTADTLRTLVEAGAEQVDGHAVYDKMITYGEEYAYFRCTSECERVLVARWRLRATPNILIPGEPTFPKGEWPAGWWRPPTEHLPGYYAHSSPPRASRFIAVGPDGTWYYHSASYAMER